MNMLGPFLRRSRPLLNRLLSERLDMAAQVSSSSSVVTHGFKDTIYALSSGDCPTDTHWKLYHIIV